MVFFTQSALIGAIVFSLGASAAALAVYFILLRLVVPHSADDSKVMALLQL